MARLVHQKAPTGLGDPLEPSVCASGLLPRPLSPQAFLEPRVLVIGPPLSASSTLFPQASTNAMPSRPMGLGHDTPRPVIQPRASKINPREHFHQSSFPDERRSGEHAPLIPTYRGGGYIGSTAADAKTQTDRQQDPHPIDEVNMIQQIHTYYHAFGYTVEAVATALRTVGYPMMAAETVQHYLDYYKDKELWGPTDPIMPKFGELPRA